ncbi:MAG: MFS transporter [Acidimicrobiales bacterium]|nr:MFS transporter [Acidimicrobiales bacterium]MCB9393499.1 MFS transporter [Acidimicrobiaceae bacterium]
MSTPAPAAAATPGGIDPHVYHRRWAILATMCLSLVLIVATVSSVNVAIPSLASSDLNPTDTQILWIVDSYALVFAALLLPAGALGDRFGRKGALLVGLTVFATASALSAVMGSATGLLAMRAVMGVGAALIMPSTLSLLQSSFPPAERAKAIAVWAGFAGAGGAIGPVMGGFLLEHFWYGSVFFVAVPIAAVAFVASAVLAPRSKEGAGAALDPLGSVLSILGFGALLFAIIEGPERGWTDVLVVLGFAVAALGLVGFVVYERRTAEPLLDMTYFRTPRFAMGSLGITFTFFGMFATFFVLTQYLQYVKGYTPLGAGLRGLPFAATMIVVSPRSADLAARLGVRKVVGAGMVTFAIGMLLLSFADQGTPYGYVALCLVLAAAGVGSTMPSFSAGIVQSVPMHKAGVGSAVNDTTREVGGAMGIAVVGSVVSSVYRDRLSPVLAELPPELADVARDNVAKALGVAERAESVLGPERAAALSAAVRDSYVDGFHLGLRIAVVVVLAAAAVVVARIGTDDTLGARHHH